MESHVNIKQESLDENSVPNNNVKHVPCIKIEPKFGSEPKLYISSCETCETSIEPRLADINIKKEPIRITKQESNDTSESEDAKPRHLPVISSSIASNFSPAPIASNFSPAPTNVKQNNSPIPSKFPNRKRTNFVNSLNLKRSDSPCLSSKKNILYPFQPRFSDGMQRSSSLINRLHFQQVHRPRHSFKNFHHRKFKHRWGSSNNTGRPNWVRNFPHNHWKNKENKYVAKTEEKPESQLRIVKMINSNLEVKVFENPLKEQNYPATSSTCDFHLNFPRDESPCNQTDSKGEKTNLPSFNNEVNNNVDEDLQEDQNSVEYEIEEIEEIEEIYEYEVCEDDDSEANVNADHIVHSDRSEIGENSQIVSCLDSQDEVSQDHDLQCMSNSDNTHIDSEEESTSPESCLILNREGEESETYLVLDEVSENECNSEELQTVMGAEGEHLKIYSNGIKPEIANLLMDVGENDNFPELKTTNQKIETTVDSETTATNNLKENSDIMLSLNEKIDVSTTDIVEVENNNMDVDDSDILEVLEITQAEVEVVKEVSCDGDIECVFSKLKEVHLCTKCFVERRKKKRKLDTDVIVLKVKNKDNENIPIISIDEM